MGLNTGWNTAISLRSSGEDSSDRRRHQDAARLPVGIDAIRKHLAEVDNVPLLVPLFTDCTSFSNRIRSNKISNTKNPSRSQVRNRRPER